MQLHAETSGHGTVVLCLHGIGSSSISFRHQLDGLSGERRVIAWDAPGYARSPDPPAAPGMDGYADAAKALLEGLGVETAHVVGSSFGGVVAVRLALRHPGVVLSLVLADTTPGSAADPDKRRAMRRRGDELAALGVERFAAERAPRLLSRGAPAELVDELRRIMVASIRLPGYRWAAEAMAATDHREQFGDLRVPTLVLCGTEDRITPPAVSEAIAARVRKAELALIDGAGHASNQERPEQFNALVARFIDEVENHRDQAGTPVTVQAPREET